MRELQYQALLLAESGRSAAEIFQTHLENVLAAGRLRHARESVVQLSVLFSLS